MMIAFIVTPTIYNFPNVSSFFVCAWQLFFWEQTLKAIEEMGGNGFLLTCR